MEKATRQFTKNHNITLVLKTIFQHESISRAEIARITKLTRTTVSDIVGKLIGNGLVKEVGYGETAVGKPPVMVSVETNARCIICMDLSRRDFRAAVVNLRGEILKTIHAEHGRLRGEDGLNQVFLQLDALIGSVDLPILGIGIGTPGLIDMQEGVVKRAVNLGWNGLPLKKILQDRYNLPVYVANDSHAAALAENSFGAQREQANLIVVKAGEGIGSGIILDHHLFYGDGFAAGEIGHLVVADNGIQCTCGNTGCLETVASTRVLLQEASQHLSAAGAPTEKVLLSDLKTAYQEGSAGVIALISSAANALGVAVAHLIGILDIHQIIFTGELTELGEDFLVLMREQARNHALSNMIEQSSIQYSALGADHVLLGASALVLSEELGLP